MAMRGRCKRQKCAQSSVPTSEALLLGGTRDSEAQSSCSGSQQTKGGFKVDCSMFESGSFASRCSVRLIHEVISSFDIAKRELVKAIGFGGLLYFPPIKQFNRKFALWLMSRVNENVSCISIGEHISISFNKYDVGHVFGIPSTGKPVIDVLVDSREAKDKVIENFLGVDFKDQKSIKIVQEIIERQFSNPVSKVESDRFMVAFVVFVMSNLLAPSAKFDYASVDYWNAIQDPADICTYDWGGYVISRLLEAVCKLKQDISNNIKYPNISGCSIFLQVLYLDSLQLGDLSMPHHSLPRVQHFSFDTMRSMISADKNYSRHLKDDHQLPVGKLRDPSGCIYSWAVCSSEVSDEASGCPLYSIWECATALVHLLNIPLEAAGPIFVAAADFQNQINGGLAVNGTQAIKFISVLVSLLIPFTRGFRYKYSSARVGLNSDFSQLDTVIANGIRLISRPIRAKRKKGCYDLEAQCAKYKEQSEIGGLAFQRSSSAESSLKHASHLLQHTPMDNEFERSAKFVWSSLDDMPHYLNVNLRVATSMSQFYSLLRKIKEPNHFDLNECGTDMENSNSYSHISPGIDVVSVPSPWDLGYSWSYDDVDCTVILRKLHGMLEDDRLAIVHRFPRYIGVACSDLCCQLLGNCEMELDLFDAFVRLSRQEDEVLYSAYGHHRWRFFFETNFMVDVLSGSLDLVGPNLAEHLSISNTTIDVRKCKIVFFPVLLQFQWICFAWQTEDNVISVFEPSYAYPLPEHRAVVIERTAFLLKLALHTLSSSVFFGSSNDVSSAELRMLNFSANHKRGYNRSGVICSLFYRCYDGSDLNLNSEEVDEEGVAAKLFIQIPNLKDNSGLLALPI